MNNIPINEAETIFDPFWNHENALNQYQVDIHPDAKAEVVQTWCGSQITIYQGAEGQPSVTLSRSCKMAVSDYNILRFFLSLQKVMRVRVSCELDGAWQTLIHSEGNDSTREYDGSMKAAWMTGIRIEFFAPKEGRSSSLLEWLGMANSAKQAEMEAKKPPYTADWPGCFTDKVHFAPQLGLYFDRDGLAKIRQKIRQEPFRSIMERLRREAEADLSVEPESQVGTYVSRNDRRWERDRDMTKTVTKDKMANLAFVGLVDEDERFTRMACRMAMAVCHSTYWYESFMGHFPGATWHHRSFTEEELCTAVVSVLDWAGGMLTDYAKDLILDGLKMKGLPRIESDFKVFDYIWSMNQGIVFSSGRIHALLALTPRYPRYGEWLDMAERDFKEMVNRYILEDGGTLEGPSYWNYTFRNALPTAYLLARRHGIPLKDYVWEKLRKTGDMGPLMLSTTGDGTTFTPINDAHNESFAPIVTALYAQISDRPEWKYLYAKALESGHAEQGGNRFGNHNAGRDFIIMAENQADTADLPRERFVMFPNTMQCALTRPLGEKTTHFHFISGPVSAGHYHEDKGSFILEINGESLLLDRGICHYHSPYVTTLPKAEYHNLLMPESESAVPIMQAVESGDVTMTADYREGHFTASTDLTGAWQNGIFTACSREVDSPNPALYTITDKAELCASGRLSFRLNTMGSARQENGSVILTGEKSAVRITPLNWQPDEVWFEPFGVDEKLNPVNQLRLYTGTAKNHHLVTQIEVI